MHLPREPAVRPHGSSAGPRPFLAVYTTNLRRSLPWRQALLLLLLLVFLSGIHLHGLAFPRSDHAGKTTPPHTVLFSNRRSLSFFLSVMILAELCLKNFVPFSMPGTLY